MNPRPLKVGSCFRSAGVGRLVPKKSYDTGGDAWYVAEQYGFRAYECPDCGKWHIASS